MIRRPRRTDDDGVGGVGPETDVYIPILYVCAETSTTMDGEEGDAESRKDVADEWRRERNAAEYGDSRDA